MKGIISLITSLLIVSGCGFKFEISDDVGRITRYSQEEGEGKLCSLLLNAQKEDSWAFVERGDRYFWVNTGWNLTKGSVKTGIPEFQPGDVVTFYHIHPLKFDEMNSLGMKDSEYIILRSDGPSKGDWLADAKRRQEISQIWGESVKVLPSKVVSRNGVFSYQAPRNLTDGTEVQVFLRDLERIKNGPKWLVGEKDWRQFAKEKGYFLGYKSFRRNLEIHTEPL